MDAQTCPSRSAIFGMIIAKLSGAWRNENIYKLTNQAGIHVEFPISNLQNWYTLASISRLAHCPISCCCEITNSGLLNLILSGSVEAFQMAVRSIDTSLRSPVRFIN